MVRGPAPLPEPSRAPPSPGRPIGGYLLPVPEYSHSGLIRLNPGALLRVIDQGSFSLPLDLASMNPPRFVAFVANKGREAGLSLPLVWPVFNLVFWRSSRRIGPRVGCRSDVRGALLSRVCSSWRASSRHAGTLVPETPQAPDA